MSENATIRGALLAGVGLTFGVWLLAGSYYTHRIADISLASQDLDVRYLRSEELLSSVRADVLLGSIDLRDALLATEPAAIESYRRQIHEAASAASDALHQLRPVVDSPEARKGLAGLRRDVDAFHATLTELLAADRQSWRSGARAELAARVAPEGQHAVGTAETIQAFNQTAFIEQDAALTGEYAQAVRGVWGSLGLGVISSLAVAFVVGRQAQRLDARLTAEQQRVRQHRDDLQRLSARLLSVQEDERRTVARELHDEIGQVLTAMKVELASAQRAMVIAGGDPHRLDDARRIADRALAGVRDLSQLLHPAGLDDLGLEAALESHIREYETRFNIPVTLEHDDLGARLPAAAETALYRIAQEALTNVARHASATRGRVELRRRGASVVMTIEDDGCGFTPTGATPNGRTGLGLVGIRARLEQLSGTLRVESTPGKGTRLTATVPFTPIGDAHHG